MADETQPFVIPVRRTWLLLILPILALLYFVGVVVLNILDYRIEGVSNEMLALGGVAFFGLVILVELPFFLRRSRPRAKKVKAAPAAPAPAAPATRAPVDDEVVTTDETQQGLRVVEYSSPARSRNANAVYTKTYVPVSGAHVLRIESMVADASDL